MDLYWFERGFPVAGGFKSRSKELEENGFDGTMYPYGIFINDYFTRIARHMDTASKFKYLVAIRPYVLSAQYLHMICSSLNEISNNRVSINFVNGWILDPEKEFGGIISEINDRSPSADRSNYMFEYVKEFERISDTNFYMSTTKESVFDYSVNNKFSMIIPYSWYKTNRFNLDGQKYIISIAPVISDYKKDLPSNQDSDLFTEQEFFQFLDDCNMKNVYGILMSESVANQEYRAISSAVKKYKMGY